MDLAIPIDVDRTGYNRTNQVVDVVAASAHAESSGGRVKCSNQVRATAIINIGTSREAIERKIARKSSMVDNAPSREINVCGCIHGQAGVGRDSNLTHS